MIKVVLFPQIPIIEQDRINNLNGSRRAENKKFKLGSKVKS